MNISAYKRAFGFYIRMIQKRVDRIEARLPVYGYFALTLFVAIPLPVTGAWTGTLIAWILGLERTRSKAAIALGVCIAGLIILIASLGILNLLSLL
jgi:uncharacterized membrane protein